MTKAKPKPPRFHDLPAGTRVVIDLDAFTRLYVPLARAPRQLDDGSWVVEAEREDGTLDVFAFSQLRGCQRGHTPRKPPKHPKAPTISIERVEAAARALAGDQFVRVEVKPRQGRSERITIYTLTPGLEPGKDGYSHKLSFTKDRPGGDPDAVRRWFLEFCAECAETARKKAAEATEAGAHG